MIIDVGRWRDDRHRRRMQARMDRFVVEHKWHYKFTLFRMVNWGANEHSTRPVLLICARTARKNWTDSWQYKVTYIYGPLTNILTENK